MIPQILHFVWLGPTMPEKYQDNIRAWRAALPEYQIRVWTEHEIMKLGLVAQAKFQSWKTPSYRSDVARWEILYHFGGIYLDTDTRPLGNPRLLLPPGYHTVGYSYSDENLNCLDSNFFACEPKSPVISAHQDRLITAVKDNTLDSDPSLWVISPDCNGPGVLVHPPSVVNNDGKPFPGQMIYHAIDQTWKTDGKRNPL